MAVQNDEPVVVNDSMASQNDELVVVNDSVAVQNDELVVVNDSVAVQNDELVVVNESMAVQNDELVVVNDFTVIQVKTIKRSQTTRCLYIKENDGHEAVSSRPAGQTLFVLNVPPYVTENDLKHLFSECGVVNRVYLQSKPSSAPPLADAADRNNFFSKPACLHRGYQVAYVVFKDNASLKRATQMPYSRKRFLSLDSSQLVTGLKKYRKAYVEAGPPPADVLQSQIKSYIKKYDQRVAEEKQTTKDSEGVPDEDGWITVSRSKGVANTQVNDERVKRKLKKRNREKELLHFYNFQVRESKKEHLTTLRKKFEEDKQKIAQLRAERKFRPY